MRAFWYQCMTALREDESIQRRGLVYVSLGNITVKQHQFVMKFHILRKTLPTRTMAIHICLQSRTLHPLIKLILLGVGTEYRLRLRIHMEGRTKKKQMMMIMMVMMESIVFAAVGVAYLTETTWFSFLFVPCLVHYQCRGSWSFRHFHSTFVCPPVVWNQSETCTIG